MTHSSKLPGHVVDAEAALARLHRSARDALVEARELLARHVRVLRIEVELRARSGLLARVDEEVVHVARVVVALPAVGERRVVGPLARGGPLARPAEALALRLARRLRSGTSRASRPGERPFRPGTRSGRCRSRCGRSSVRQCCSWSKAWQMSRWFEVVVLQVDARSLDVGAEQGRVDVSHAGRAGGRGRARTRARRGRGRGRAARTRTPSRTRGSRRGGRRIPGSRSRARSRPGSTPAPSWRPLLHQSSSLSLRGSLDRSAVTSSTVADGWSDVAGLRVRIPEVRPPGRPLGRVGGTSSMGGGGSVGASESSRLVLGAGLLRRDSGSLGRLTAGLVSPS